jgi:hypothetical protein
LALPEVAQASATGSVAGTRQKTIITRAIERRHCCADRLRLGAGPGYSRIGNGWMPSFRYAFIMPSAARSFLCGALLEQTKVLSE